jgi:adenylate cyclase
MSESEPGFLRHCLQGLDVAIAVADGSGRLLFENARFFKLFPAEVEAADQLAARLPMLDWAKADARLDAGRSFSQEVSVKAGARTLTLDMRVRRETFGGAPVTIAEGHDISKRKEAEYMLDSYARMAEKNAKELTREKERVEKLLLNVMPRSVYDELKEYGTTTPLRFTEASVLMLDFADFTDMAVAQDPGALVAELNDIFSAFDRIVELYACERIKTIGDAYVAVAGLPDPNPEHAAHLARVAVRMKRYLERRNDAHPTEWRFRIGMASGAIIGSMVGIQKYVYDIFGPAVNLAARMEEHCEPMDILMTGEMAAALGNGFDTQPAGVVEVKGFGAIETVRLVRERRP